MAYDPLANTSYSGVRLGYDDPRRTTANFGDYDDYTVSRRNYEPPGSPTTTRRKIAELERRLSDLRENSEAMALKLGRAEKTLRELDLEPDDDGNYSRRHHRQADRIYYNGRDTRDSFDRRHYRQHSGDDEREALRREIARLREDLSMLRRHSGAHGDVTDYVDAGRDVSRRHRCCDHVIDDVSDEFSDWNGRKQLYTSDDSMLYERRRDARFNDYQLHSPTCCSGTGQRTVLRRPVTTQHNKTRLSPTSNRKWYDAFSTSNKRSFRPRQAADVNIGDVVKFRRSNGRMDIGRVMYVGHLPGKTGAFLGVELENNTGNHDGEYDGFRYFQCKPNRGLFVQFDHVIMAWGSL